MFYGACKSGGVFATTYFSNARETQNWSHSKLNPKFKNSEVRCSDRQGARSTLCRVGILRRFEKKTNTFTRRFSRVG